MKVIVQEEIKKEKCKWCNEYGRCVVQEYHGGFYYPYCTCDYGQWLKDHEPAGDMFYQARHGC